MTSALILATVTHWAVPAMSEVMRLPDAVPADGEKGGTVTIVAARDEYEPGSFVIRSDVDLGKVKLELSTFTNAHGVVLPPEQLDLKFVKVWYQNRNAWFNYFGDTGFKLCPELLVNDEDLIRVDTEKVANYARLVEADGTVHERWLNPPRQMDRRPHTQRPSRNESAFLSMKPNFRDAKTLQPVALPANESKQFILTVHATKETPAGRYCGQVEIKGGGGQWTVPVVIRVLDFVLPRPAPFADPAGDFPIAFYSYDDVDHALTLNGGDRALAVKQLLAVRKDQLAHGQTAATLGHSDRTTALEPVDGKDWGGFTGRGGTECRYCSCPRQPGFLAYVRGMAKLYAAFRPGSVWIDDDLRSVGSRKCAMGIQSGHIL